MTRRITLAIAVALAALLLCAGLANAQEPPDADSATRLEPGLNLVGWVGEPAPVSQLFRDIPRLEAIWAWDAELRDWIVAAPGAPEWLGGLGRVTAGMGLRMQLGGDQPYLWRRSTEPTRGLVKLRTGWNLVAWSGADGAAIGDVVKGIGWSLRTVRRWDAASQQWVTWTSPERSAQVIANTNADQGDAGDDAQPVGIRRGEALWIEVARAVNWLQPTDILPRLVFPGGASGEFQSRVRGALESVLTFFRDQYGIQADPDFTIYVARDADALIQAWKDDGEGVNDARAASTRTQWNRKGGWVDDNYINLNQAYWSRYIVAHEYFHILQLQLSSGQSSAWLFEGGAEWAASEYKVLDSGDTTLQTQLSDLRSMISRDTPSLRSTEFGNGTWEYELGWLATNLLTANAGADSWIEFWRQLAPTKIGPHRRWESTPDWRTAFQDVFGQPVSEFYADFNAWQREQAAANPVSTSPTTATGIRGRVTDVDGAPVGGVFVNAFRASGGRNQRAETNGDGAFAVRAPEAGDYLLSVDINENCVLYYSDGGLINDWGQRYFWPAARPVKVGQSGVSDIDIQLPSNACGWQIRGRIVGPNAEPLAGLPIKACPAGYGGQCHSSASEADGSFTVTVAASREYRLSANLGHSCSVYFRSGVPTTNRSSASRITVADAHVGDILIRVSADLCRLRVAGFVGGIGRFLYGYGHVSMGLCRVVDNRCESTPISLLEGDGPFTFATPTPGNYRLTYDLNGCRVHYGPTGLTVNVADATLINVDSRDVRVAYRQIPTNVCAYQIEGSITRADGRPLTDTSVWACLDGYCVSAYDYTGDDGTFAIIVPTDGEYSLQLYFDRCVLYFRDGGFTTTRSERATVRVNGRDLRLSHRQITADMCAASD